MKKLLLTAIVALTAATAGASDYIEHQIYSDRNFDKTVQKPSECLNNAVTAFTISMLTTIAEDPCWK